jgi:hypothetical protein
MTPAENLGPDAEFIGAGDDVVVIQGGRITVRGVLVDVDENGDAIVNTVQAVGCPRTTTTSRILTRRSRRGPRRDPPRPQAGAQHRA